MRIFNKFPEKEKCPICRTNEQGECVLIGIDGTQEDNNMEAKVFHLKCIELIYYSKHNTIGMKW